MTIFKKERGLALRNSKGFTIIELLVVVAIIGLLASITLGYLSSARKKGDDAAVKSNLATVRQTAEIYFLDNGNSYIKPGGFGNDYFEPLPCSPESGNPNYVLYTEPTISALKMAKDKGFYNPPIEPAYCFISSTNWAVAIRLKLDPTKSWCVDSKPSATLEPFMPNAAIDPATGLCF